MMIRVRLCEQTAGKQHEAGDDSLGISVAGESPEKRMGHLVLLKKVPLMAELLGDEVAACQEGIVEVLHRIIQVKVRRMSPMSMRLGRSLAALC